MTSRKQQTKPKKPYKTFPLQPYDNGQWGKKINGTRRHFGVWANPQAALEKYNQQRAEWEAGRDPRLVPPPVASTAPSLGDLADRWLVMRKELIDCPDPDARISRTTWAGSKAAMILLIGIMGGRSDPMTWTPEDFRRLRLKLAMVTPGVTRKVAKGERPAFKKAETATVGDRAASPATKGQRIMYVRAMFDWAASVARLVPQTPDYGGEFDPVGKAEKDRFRYQIQKKNGERVFEPDDARRILRAWDDAVSARPHRFTGSRVEWREHVSARLMRACTYLAANTGAYSADISELTISELSLDDGYLERLREKTATLWQATLWPVTVQAIREYLEVRPTPARSQWSELVFITTNGYPVNHGDAAVDADERDTRTDVLRQNTSKLLRDLGLKRTGVTFGAWRHTFRTLAATALGMDVQYVERLDAINRITAHKIPGSANSYVKLRKEQLLLYTDGVRAALWPEQAPSPVPGTTGPLPTAVTSDQLVA
jgi:integrase